MWGTLPAVVRRGSLPERGGAPIAADAGVDVTSEQVDGYSTHDSHVLGASCHGRRPCIGFESAGRQPVQAANGTTCPRGRSLESPTPWVYPESPTLGI
jgi:hypothetical protein